MKLVGARRTKTAMGPSETPRRDIAEPSRTERATVEPRRAVRKEKRGRSSKAKVAIITTILILCILVAGVIGAAIGLNTHLSSLDTIFPNVWAEGVLLSGMTFDEAVQALIDDGYEDNASDISMTLVFPDETYFTLTGEEIGLALNAEEAVEVAFSFGRERNPTLLQNEITFVRSFFGARTDLSDLSSPNIDISMLPDLATSLTMQFNESVIESNFEYDGETITLVKGVGFVYADSDTVYELARTALMQAIEENTHVVVEYHPETIDDEFDLQTLFETIHTEPASSRYDPEIQGASPSVIGRSFDLAEAQRMLDNAEAGEEVIIHIIETLPEYTQEQIEEMILRDVLGERTTSIAGTANRLHNIVLTSDYINETILQPGDVFSFNEVVGRRTAARGFREAGAFINGRLQDITGGGICQTSSTLYAAILHTRLEVVARRNHSRRVTYLPLGQDATIVYGQTDLRFKNNTDFPVKVESSVVDREITVRLIGTRLDDIRIEVETVIIREIPFSTIREYTDELDHGVVQRVQGANGIPGGVADVFQRFYDADGNLIDRVLVGRSEYLVQNRVYLVGTRGAPPPDEGQTDYPEPTPTPPDYPEPTPTPTPPDYPEPTPTPPDYPEPTPTPPEIEDED